MKINGNAIRPGNVIQHRNRLMVAVKVQHTQPGKGGAYAQVELKDIRDGTKMNERFRSSESVERIRLEEIPYQYLYAEGDHYVFMHNETFEQVSLHASSIADQVPFLQEGLEVMITSHDGEIIGLQLPDHMAFEVVEADAVVKGQTAASSYKPAVLENGLKVMVPPHITVGTKIVINTGDLSYVERAK